MCDSYYEDPKKLAQGQETGHAGAPTLERFL